MKPILKIVTSLVAIHLLVAIVPSLLIENKITAAIIYYSIFFVLQIASDLGLAVFGIITEDTFMAPINLLGWSFIILFWSIVHSLLGYIVLRMFRLNKR
jgi:hypothetical protein